jgi:hypothetical protein
MQTLTTSFDYALVSANSHKSYTTTNLTDLQKELSTNQAWHYTKGI